MGGRGEGRECVRGAEASGLAMRGGGWVGGGAERWGLGVENSGRGLGQVDREGGGRGIGAAGVGW